MAAANSPISQTSRATALAAFPPLGSRRLLALGGIGLILVGMIFGDAFAIFVLHQNAAHVGASLSAAAHAALAGDVSAVATNFQNVGSLLENRGTKVDTHVHMIGFGYLALTLAILQPWVALTEAAKRRLAWLFLCGATLLPIAVFLIDYIGLAYSPFQAIGWASVFADFGGLLVLLASLGFLLGLWKHYSRDEQQAIRDELLVDGSAVGCLLLAGGLALIVLGFLHGAYYAAVDLYKQERADSTLLGAMSQGAVQRQAAVVEGALTGYGQLQGDKAVKIAAHAHSIEFGLLAMVLAFFQPIVNLSDRWKYCWAWILLAGSVLLPVCVLLELQFGLIAGGLADFGGLLVIVALLGMWIGILRYTGELDARAEAAETGAVP